MHQKCGKLKGERYNHGAQQGAVVMSKMGEHDPAPQSPTTATATLHRALASARQRKHQYARWSISCSP